MRHLYCRKVYSRSVAIESLELLYFFRRLLASSSYFPALSWPMELHSLPSDTTLAPRLEFLPNRLATVRGESQVRAPAQAHLTSGAAPHVTGTTDLHARAAGGFP
jgi:hypothetical protein